MPDAYDQEAPRLPCDAIVLGGSGAVGRFLLQRLHEQDADVLVVSRRAPPAWARGWRRQRWIAAVLDRDLLLQLPPAERLFSAGPLDLLAAACVPGWPAQLRGLVALSSLSTQWKQDSLSDAERALAKRLLEAERQLGNATRAAGVPLQILRPGMIYGAGIDQNLSRLLRIARRWRCLPWPRSGRGLRSPVHADDIAAAMLAAARLAHGDPRPFALPGPDRLPFDRIVDRLLRDAAPGARRLPLPLPQRWLRRLAAGSSRGSALAAVVLRSALDQIAGDDDWARLGIAPRSFSATAENFRAWPE